MVVHREGSGLSIAGSVAWSDIDSSVISSIDSNSDITSYTLDIKSDDTSYIGIIAGALSATKGSGIGASFVKNHIVNTIESSVKDSKINISSAARIIANSNPTIQTIAAAVSAAKGGMSAAITIVLNSIESDVKSYISGTDSNNSRLSAGSVRIKSNEASDIDVIVGSGGITLGSGGAGVGASVVSNYLKNNVKSYVDNTNLDIADLLIIDSLNKRDIFEVITAGAVGGEVAISGNLGINNIQGTAKSYVVNSDINTFGNMEVTATSDNTIKTYAGAISASKTAGVGLSYLQNNIGTNDTSSDYAFVEAYISGSDINTKYLNGNGNLKVNATNKNNLESFAIGAGFSGKVSAAVNINKNYFQGTTQAFIQNGNSNLKINTNNLEVKTNQENTIDTKSGSLAASGTGAIGGAYLENDSDTKVLAIVKNIDVNASGTSIIDAQNTKDLHLYQLVVQVQELLLFQEQF